MKNTIKHLLWLAVLVVMVLQGCQNKQDAVKLDRENPFAREFNTPFGVPPFDQIRPEHFMPAFEAGMAEQLTNVDEIVKNKVEPTFENTILALDKSGDLLGKVASVFFGLTGVSTSEELQNIEMGVAPLLSAHGDAISLNPDLFKRIKAVWEMKSSLTLSDEEAYVLENLYKGFVRNGANLPPEKQEMLRELNQKLSVATVKFDQNVLAETNDFKLVIDNPADLAGLPDGVISAAAEAAASASLDGKWLFTTQKPSMLPFLTYAENRDLRKTLYQGYLMRGNRNNERDNKQLLSEIMSLRVQRAQLLGYETHAHLVLEPRMAKVPSNVIDLLDKVWTPALNAARKDLAEMQAMVDREGGQFNIESSDWWYYAEKLRKAKYNLDDNELRPYFELKQVIDGVFMVANKLYGITFHEIAEIPLPNPEAMAFEVKEADGSHIGVLYMDYHPRASKQQGAWCGEYRTHEMKDGREITPVVTMVGNFTRPTGETPSLLSLDEVSTLFHEFGHALDALFAKNSLSTTYIAWDFVELPSQIMEHWATEPEVLKMYAKHYQTGEVIPDDLIAKLTLSGTFNQGFTSTEFVSACYLDMAYHTLTDATPVDVEAFQKSVAERLNLIPEIEFRYNSTYFIHITGGYDAGYYSYEWSAVLDHDAFEAFKEKGLFDQASAASFRKNILEKNGTMDPMQMFINFRGREPDITPLMRNRGFL